MKRIARYAAVALILGLAVTLTLAFRRDPHDIKTGTVGKPAPAFALPSLADGTIVSLDQYKGKVVVLNFWASWCPPCQEEAPLFNQIQDTYRRRGVAVVGIDSQDFANDARAFARRLHVDYTLVRDPSNDVTNRWGVTSGFPVTFVIANNHFEGKAAVNVVQLRRMLGQKNFTVPETLVARYPVLEKAIHHRDTEAQRMIE